MTELIHGDCLEVLRAMPDCSVDAVVTDPPYGLSFMGKKWDYDVPGVEVWAECFRVLKPGGHLLCFAGTRTQHRMAVRIEDAGFEIRDMIAWVYGSGFPKSLDVSKAIDKAAGAEREVVGNNPTFRKMQENASNYNLQRNEFITAPATEAAKQWQGWGTALKPALEPITVARKPLIGTVAENVLQHGTGAINVDGCRVGERWPANFIHDGSEEATDLLGASARFFYCAKASKRDRDEGVAGLEKLAGGMSGRRDGSMGSITMRKNHHPTVKPTDLMRYLCRLVTPPDGTVLDPFMGSGSTGKAAVLEGFRFIGIEREEEYCEIAKARIKHAQQ
jgi:DNA modification methylase